MTLSSRSGVKRETTRFVVDPPPSSPSSGPLSDWFSLSLSFFDTIQFSCFVEDCGRKCRTPQKRRLHLIDKHMFPKNYFFAVTKAGIDGRRSLLTDGHARRRSSTAGTVKRIRARRRASSDGTVEGVQPERQSDAATDEMAKEDVVLEDAVTADPSSPGVGKPTGEEVSEEPEGKPDTEMEALAGAMSSLRFVPASICFGRRKGKTGFSAT